jgi:hypothetical protein
MTSDFAIIGRQREARDYLATLDAIDLTLHCLAAESDRLRVLIDRLSTGAPDEARGS